MRRGGRFPAGWPPNANVLHLSPRNEHRLNRPDLLSLTPELLNAKLSELDAPVYRGRQILRHVWKRFATTFEQMSDLPAPLRVRLREALALHAPDVVAEQCSGDGSTRKALLRLDERTTVETVLMRYNQSERGRARNTVCISTQAGCAMGCVFCATGQQGFLRNLSVGEIVSQVLHFVRLLAQEDDHITNIVFMGMGEPFANYDNTVAALRALIDPERFGLGARHITVSTVGLTPMMRRFAGEGLQVGLALSLHAADDGLRRQLVPTTRSTIDELLDAAQAWAEATGRRFSVEYALVDHQNDSIEQARLLARRLKNRHCHVNLIPVNPTANTATRRSHRARVLGFEKELLAAGINTTVRVEKGIDIAAGCGQLRGSEEGRRAVAGHSPLAIG